jgi:RNA ligase (TIGR02306 family)
MRKLASIQEVKEILPIKSADSIESAKILGWNVVIRKIDNFKAGDLVVYIEIDSVLPEREEFEFLRERKFKIKTIKLRGIVSQGIAFPLSILPKDSIGSIKIGDDVTEILGVIKYEPPIPEELWGVIKGDFPSFISKTDETRIQTVPNILKKHKGELFYMSEKMEGDSFTFYAKDDVFGVCTRGREWCDAEKNMGWRLARKYNLEEILLNCGFNVAIQGEGLGLKIQRNIYKLEDNIIMFFNVFDIDNFEYFNFKKFKEFTNKYKLPIIPILNDNFILDHSVDELVAISEGKSVLNKETEREGIVIRSLEEKFDEELGRLSFKVHSPKYLLKTQWKRKKKKTRDNNESKR